MNPADAFSQSYAEARAKFLVTAQAAGAKLSDFPHPLKGPQGEALACDVARFGAEDAEAVFRHVRRAVCLPRRPVLRRRRPVDTANGHIGLPFPPLYDQAKSDPVLGLEYGTLPSIEVRAALRADHRLHARGKLDSEQGRAIKKRLRDVFYVDTESWKKQVMDRADELTGKAIVNLAR